jgi:undecaprenyl diphosphate synthase
VATPDPRTRERPDLPRHVAIIMDGNGRWAKARGLPRLAGHRAGTEALRRVLRAAIELDIEILTIYAFSTENWRRPPTEVRGLLLLLEEVIDRQLGELDEAGIQLRHIGWLDGIPKHLGRAIEGAVARTAHNDRLVLNVAFNYGSRMEIVRAARALIRDGVGAEDVDEAALEARLETHGLPDPDLVIRTSGEMRLSNFLLWQAAYAEFFCTETLWPDFDKSDLEAALADYAQRQRRYGLVPTDAEAAHDEEALGDVELETPTALETDAAPAGHGGAVA